MSCKDCGSWNRNYLYQDRCADCNGEFDNTFKNIRDFVLIMLYIVFAIIPGIALFIN